MGRRRWERWWGWWSGKLKVELTRVAAQPDLHDEIFGSDAIVATGTLRVEKFVVVVFAVEVPVSLEAREMRIQLKRTVRTSKAKAVPVPFRSSHIVPVSDQVPASFATNNRSRRCARTWTSCSSGNTTAAGIRRTGSSLGWLHWVLNWCKSREHPSLFETSFSRLWRRWQF